MNKILEILFGLIILVIPIYAWITNVWSLGDSAFVFLKGGLVWGLIFIGLVLLIVGIADLKK